MRFTTIFHFLNLEQSFSRIILIHVDRLYIIAKNKFTILFFERDLNIKYFKKILVKIIKCQMSFKFTFTSYFGSMQFIIIN